GYRGVSFDTMHDSTIGTTGLKAALETVEKRTGVKPDVLVFDACEMAQTEVAYQMRDRARVLVGSEEEIGDVGLPYAQWLGELQTHPKMDAEELGRAIVQKSADDESDRTDNGEDDAASQLSALDLSHVGGLKKAVDKLADALVDSHARPALLTHVLQASKRFDKGSHARPANNYRDLGDIANILLHSQQITSPAARRAAQSVQHALSQVVLSNETEADGMARATGLSIYLPPHFTKDEAVADERYDDHGVTHYPDLDFAHDSHWLRLLHYLDGAPR
ncbi:MAG: clostripain-related cysteine peptidase, partial [Candidatus Xenobia bacterium]